MAAGAAPKRKRTPLAAFAYWTAVVGVWGVIFLVVFFAVFARDLPDTSTLYDVDRQPSITYLDRNGALIAVRGTPAGAAGRSRRPARLCAGRLHRHRGPALLPPPRLRPDRHDAAPWPPTCAPAASSQGGSTLTQQLAKNLFLTPDQNMKRKVQELMLAVWLEMKFSKKEILALYLNRVYFGAGAYGIEAASQRYFDKRAKPADRRRGRPAGRPAEGARRAIRPVSESERAARPRHRRAERDGRRRRHHARAARRRPCAEPGARLAHPGHPARPVFRRLAGQADPRPGRRADRGHDRRDHAGPDRCRPRPSAPCAASSTATGPRASQQAALVALDGEGRVRAMIGGASYADSQFNRAVDARRQAGSAFKPFVYLTAMESGYTPETPVVDEPIRIGNWSPAQLLRHLRGPDDPGQTPWPSRSTPSPPASPTRSAATTSPAPPAASASPAASGWSPPWRWAPSRSRRWRWPRPMTPSPTAARRVSAYGISRIRTPQGRVIYQRGAREAAAGPGDHQPVALLHEPDAARRDDRGHRHGRAAIAGRDLAGKTGTTSDYKDAWFVGYTGGFVTAVWVGKDDNTAMRGVTGGSSPGRHLARLHGGGPAAPERPAIPNGPAHARRLAWRRSRSAT